MRLFTYALLAVPWQADGLAPSPLHGARIAFVVEDVAHVPGTNRRRAHARLNALLSPPDGSHRLFVVDMDGTIRIIADGALLREPFLDMASARKDQFLDTELEQGLNSLAFHPDFARPGRPGFRKFYTFSTEHVSNERLTFASRGDFPVPAHHDVIAEWTIDPANPSKADPRSRREVMRIAHPLDDHVGGQLAFNPVAVPNDRDYGMLYIGVGDGGNTVFRHKQVDEWRTAQDKLLPLGKILRIDPIQNGERPYSVPRDNPFAADMKALPEIWAYGLRNPQRFSWDTGGDHRMLIADIGQKQFEEIDIGRRGANYGWSEREGIRVVNHEDEYDRRASARNESSLGFTAPALVYGHHVGLAITGGYAYRGIDVPELLGQYLFGDIASGRIFATDVGSLSDVGQATFYEIPLQYRGTIQSLRAIVTKSRVDLRFGADDLGHIYILSKQDGMIRRITRSVVADAPIRPVDRPIEQ